MALGRRRFLSGSAAGLLAPSACASPPRPPLDAAFVGQDPARGHVLREAGRARPTPSETIRTRVLVVGAGVAGASAAWRLARAGLSDFHVVELEPEPGGTARGGRLPRSAHPLGAHYLPEPPADFPALHLLLRELGIVLSPAESGSATRLDPLAVCPAPLERHQDGGLWFPGLYPGARASAEDDAQWQRFRAHLAELDRRPGSDGRRLFAFPVDASSRDLRHLDRLSMADYLDRLGLTSPRLRWAVGYACRDDYGTDLAQTSAFAALHHYLGRGLDDHREGRLLVWPEGNAHLVARMLHAVPAGRLHRDHAVTALSPEGEARVLDFASGRTRRFVAESILWAAPRFLLRHVLPQGVDPLPQRALTYTPWRVTNLQVTRAPTGFGAPLAWDNVKIGADHLGYVIANHTEPSTVTDPGAVLTFYEPFPAADVPALVARRRALLAADLPATLQHVRAQIEDMHPGLWAQVSHARIARWGHAMVRPVPGLLFGGTLARAAAPVGAVRPCATDVTGLPLFEQAFASGIRGAQWALARCGLPTTDLLEAPA